MSNLVANKLVQQVQAEEIQLLLEKVIERVKETPAGNIQVPNFVNVVIRRMFLIA